MTREEARSIFQHNLHDFPNLLDQTERAIDLYVALGMLKLDEPPNTAMDKLEDGLRRRYFHDAEMIGLKQALKDLGLEVVEKTKR